MKSTIELYQGVRAVGHKYLRGLKLFGVMCRRFDMYDELNCSRWRRGRRRTAGICSTYI